MPDPNPIVGWATTTEGEHVPLRADVAEQIFEAAAAAKAKRAEDMPTEQDAINRMFSAFQRLKELGWTEPQYAPKGVPCEVIEAGSTGIHSAEYWGEWPSGSWNIYEAGDIWPSNPVLARKASPTSPPSPATP